jgi:hypothetical protein
MSVKEGLEHVDTFINDRAWFLGHNAEDDTCYETFVDMLSSGDED